MANDIGTQYTDALFAAHGEFEDVLKQRNDLDRRALELKKTIEGLAALCGIDPWTDTIEREAASAMEATRRGITEAIRRVLSESKAPLSPTEIRGALIQQGISLARYANEMVVIHNTLNRLIKQDEVARVENAADRAVAYALRSRVNRSGANASGTRG